MRGYYHFKLTARNPKPKTLFMRKSYCYLATVLMAGMFSIAAFGQNVTISGNVRNSVTNDSLAFVSVAVKGTNQGTSTNENGDFKLAVAKLPVTLVFTSVGFEEKEVSVTSAGTSLSVDLAPAATLGQEVVVTATRTPQRILEAPVSIERMNARDVRNAPTPVYYDAVRNLKGVDLTTSSLTFRTPSTRGFNGSGNLRFNQLIDGIDNQAPGLNFSVGSIVGPTSLDADNMELLQGASSALYGSGGMNGTLLINSKSPFKYQGLSFEIKQGIMHTDGKERSTSPYYDWAVRWAKKINDKWAFKLSAQYLQAQDWEAQDYSNLQRNNVFSSPKAGDRTSDPNYDGVNVFGDEASANVAAFGTAGAFQVVETIKAQTGVDIGPALATLPANASIAQITSVVGSIVGGMFPPQFQQALVGPVTQGALFTVAAKSYSAVNASRTGYEEKYLVDY